jgi:serine/threonine-protein kinase
MGCVYKARHRLLNRLVALKVLRPEYFPHEKPNRFRLEAKAAASLSHPNIVQIYEVGEAEGGRFLALEYCAGGTLSERLRRGRLPIAEAAGLVRTLARAVHAAHRAGIVHRDLKPANVLLTAEGTPKIADFGLAKHLGEGLEQTLTGQVLGTPAYMAPEQASGRVREIGPATDVHGLGVILYELLTGQRPFAGPSAVELLDQVRQRLPRPPRELRREVPRDLETICLKCLQKDPARRYASAAGLADDLGRFLEGKPIRTRPVGALRRAGRWVRRRPAVPALLVLGLLVVAQAVVIGLLLFWPTR